MSTGEKNGLACRLNIDPDKKISRRDFLGLSATWACAAAWALTLIGLLKFPKPALLPDISNKFKIGKPEDFLVGTVKIFEDKNVIILRDEEGILAMSLVCTHLGCIVSKTSKGFACPCHGSRYDEKGRVIRGPAPRALDWFEISQLPGGKLLVDAGKRVPVGTKYAV
ncbi:MAG: ubiquinol-cytochrome c reductase iron-sulfur subunit [Candidatus Omnitrophica bacterium]|nr:ubiquinol-cytochrome c reductase iron-sulfur subunit [Candidatus Omnitrophota bacterium]